MDSDGICKHKSHDSCSYIKSICVFVDCGKPSASSSLMSELNFML